VQPRWSAAFTPLPPGQTKPGEPFHQPVVTQVAAT